MLFQMYCDTYKLYGEFEVSLQKILQQTISWPQNPKKTVIEIIIVDTC